MVNVKEKKGNLDSDKEKLYYGVITIGGGKYCNK
jgi:hypothetical protein